MAAGAEQVTPAAVVVDGAHGVPAGGSLGGGPEGERPALAVGQGEPHRVGVDDGLKPRPPPAGFDTTATYAGAFAPNGTNWTTGWTSFPAN